MSRFDDLGDGDESAIPPQLWNRNLRLAIHGQRGQAVLRELRSALLAMAIKELIHGDLAVFDEESGECRVCAMGALLVDRQKRGVLRNRVLTFREGRPKREWRRITDPMELSDMSGETVWELMDIAEGFGITRMLAWAISEVNDEEVDERASDAERYRSVLDWVNRQIEEPGDGDDTNRLGL